MNNLVGALAGDTSAALTIQDNDQSILGGYDFLKRDDWGSGYNGWLIVNNATTAEITGGTLIITVPTGQTLNIWGGPVATDNGDGTYTVSNLNIPAKGTIQYDLGFSNATGGTRGPIEVTLNGTILTQLPPSVSIADLAQEEGDSTGTIDFTVTLSRAHSTEIHVSYQTIDGSAAAPTDYTAQSGTLTFPVGETTRTITLAILGDTDNEDDLTLQIALAGVDGQTPPRFANPDDHLATITLINDDGPINFTATGGIVLEGDTGTRQLTFRLFLDRAVKTGETASVDYMTHGHGAQKGSDFSATTGTYTFAAGESSGMIEVPVLGDTIDERHESFNLHFHSPVGVRLISTEAAGQIIDDEFDRAKLGRQRVIAYLDGTSGTLNIPPADRVTHLMYAFANLNPDGTLAIGASVPAHLATLNALKTQNPDLKILLSVGGWTWSTAFPGVAALELNDLASIFDFVNAQGYDLHGPWNSRTGHNAGLHHNSADPLDDRLNIDSVLAQYLAGGFKRSQLLIGAPFYAQVFSNVGDTANGLFQPASPTGSTRLYRDLTTELENTVRHWDYYAKVPYLYNRDTRTWTSYDDPQAMHEKALYSRDQGFGGIYFWRNGGDTSDRQLLTTISDSLATVDHDQDGLDDSWEHAHFGDLTTANATSNQDGDPMSDLHEFLTRTDPKDARDFLRITTITPDSPTGITISFPTRPGVRYQLQTSTTLQPNSWSDAGTHVEGTGKNLDLTDPNDLPSDMSPLLSRFYRASITKAFPLLHPSLRMRGASQTIHFFEVYLSGMQKKWS